MKTQDIRKLFESTNGKIFSVTFIKKTTGEKRKLVCRTGVKSYSNGGKNNIEGKGDLMLVWSLDSKGYRCISLNNVISAKIAGVEMVFNKELENTYE